MQLKYFVILSVLGVAAAFTIPSAEEEHEKHGESSGDLQSSFASPISTEEDTASNSPRDKRGLLFKKKHSGSDTYVVNRRYEGSTGTGYEYRPNREVHHHHHYSYPQAPVVEQTYQTYPVPSNDYHHYHGASTGYASAGSGYYGGAYAGGSNGYSRPNYGGDGGYAQQYGSYQQQQQQAPIAVSPLASGHNQVDRGQGAAAVNNIAIIHARAGSSTNLVESESRGSLPHPIPVGVADALHNMMND